jgi:hypothetical protein
MLRFSIICLLIISGFATLAFLLAEALKPSAPELLFYAQGVAGLSCGASVALLADGGCNAG